MEIDDKNQHSQPLSTKHTPWYLQMVLGFSGWLTGAFLMGFLALFFSDLKTGFIVLGLVLLAVASKVLYASRDQQQDFLENLALSLSVAGQASFTLGWFETFHYSEEDILLIVAVLQLVLVVVMHSFLHRLFSAGLAGVLFYAYWYVEDLVYVADIWIICLMGFSLFCWFQMQRPTILLQTGHETQNETSHESTHQTEYVTEHGWWQTIIKPITYGMTLAVLGLHVWWASKTYTLKRHGLSYQAYQEGAGFLLVLPDLLMLVWTCMVVRHLFKRHPLPLLSLEGVLAGVGIIIFTIADSFSLGVMVSLLYLLVGFAQSNRLLQGLSVLALLGFISSYYYFLDVSLLHKSILLGVLGLVLLLSRFMLQKLGILSVYPLNGNGSLT